MTSSSLQVSCHRLSSHSHSTCLHWSPPLCSVPSFIFTSFCFVSSRTRAQVRHDLRSLITINYKFSSQTVTALLSFMFNIDVILVLVSTSFTSHPNFTSSSSFLYTSFRGWLVVLWFAAVSPFFLVSLPLFLLSIFCHTSSLSSVPSIVSFLSVSSLLMTPRVLWLWPLLTSHYDLLSFFIPLLLSLCPPLSFLSSLLLP